MLGSFARPTTHLPAPTPEMTMAMMAKLIKQGQMDSRIRLLGEQIVKGVTPQDYISEYAAVLNWVRKNIRYTRDPRTIEQLKTAQLTLDTRSADCDDLAVVIGSLLGQLGAHLRIVAGAFRDAPIASDGRRLLSHVWLEAYDPKSKSWVVLDPVPGRKVHEMLGRLADRKIVNVLL